MSDIDPEAMDCLKALDPNRPIREADIANYSITASAKEITPGGMVRPSALAVLRLITNSYAVACTTGKSAGFSPLRIRPTYIPTWRYASVTLLRTPSDRQPQRILEGSRSRVSDTELPTRQSCRAVQIKTCRSRREVRRLAVPP